MSDSVSFEHGAMHFANSLTTLALLETARVKDKSAAVIYTDAAGQIGKMLVKVCKQEKYPLINIVRR